MLTPTHVHTHTHILISPSGEGSRLQGGRSPELNSWVGCPCLGLTQASPGACRSPAHVGRHLRAQCARVPLISRLASLLTVSPAQLRDVRKILAPSPVRPPLQGRDIRGPACPQGSEAQSQDRSSTGQGTGRPGLTSSTTQGSPKLTRSDPYLRVSPKHRQVCPPKFKIL